MDDHAVVRHGLRKMLEGRPGFAVVGEATNGEEALALAGSLPLDVVMLDISMPKMSGIEAARRLRRLKPGIRILMVSMNNDAAHVMASFKSGAMGYIVKDADPDEIAQAVSKVHAGGFYCSDSVCRCVVVDTIGGERLQAQLLKAESLAPLERRILSRLTEDIGEEALSAQLGIPADQVGRALANIYSALDARSHEDIRLLALKLYLVDC